MWRPRQGPCKNTLVHGSVAAVGVGAWPLRGNRDSACVRCGQLNDLLSLVADLKMELERFLSIRDLRER